MDLKLKIFSTIILIVFLASSVSTLTPQMSDHSSNTQTIQQEVQNSPSIKQALNPTDVEFSKRDNIVNNPGFESTSDWTLNSAGYSSTHHSGSRSLTLNGNASLIYGGFDITTSQSYADLSYTQLDGVSSASFSFWIFPTSVGNSYSSSYIDTGYNAIRLVVTDGTTTYYLIYYFRYVSTSPPTDSSSSKFFYISLTANSWNHVSRNIFSDLANKFISTSNLYVSRIEVHSDSYTVKGTIFNTPNSPGQFFVDDFTLKTEQKPDVYSYVQDPSFA